MDPLEPMGLRNWLLPPRRLLALFAAVTLVPATLLVWLGWQVLAQHSRLDRDRRREHLADAADRIVAGLNRKLNAAIHDLPHGLSVTMPAALGDDALVARLGPGGLEGHRGVPLVFVPEVGDVAQPPASVWEPGEMLEARRRDFAGAAERFRALARSRDPAIRAGALVRLAGDERRLGRLDDALVTYGALAAETTVRLMGEPADLLARAARCEVLAELGRRDELDREALALARELAAGRWTIDHATWDVRTDRLRQWTRVPDTSGAVALASAVESTWRDRESAAGRWPASGSRNVWAQDRGILVAWQASGDGLVVLAAKAAYLERAWRPIWDAERVTVTLVDEGGRRVLGPAGKPARDDAVRTSAETGLPWTVRASSATSPADDAAAASRGRLAGAGLGLLVLLILAGGAVVFRAVNKELAVAALQSDFVSAVSHEFRTPLTAMAHLTDRLQRDPTIPDERRRQYYDALVRDTHRLRRFVETLLDFGRMEAGAGPGRLEPADLPAVVAAVVDEFRADRPAGCHPVSCVPVHPVPPVRLDVESFGLALWNLLDNAAKYSPDHAPIDVEVGVCEGRAEVRVRDRGAGVPESERQRIFQKFVRGSAERASGVRGTGVGLAMVDRIARAHGGGVRLDSEVGVGSTFTIWMPL